MREPTVCWALRVLAPEAPEIALGAHGAGTPAPAVGSTPMRCVGRPLVCAGLTQLPHSKPCFGSIKAHKCLVFLEECWKAHIVTNSTSFSLDFPNEYARLDGPMEVMKPKT